MVDEVVIEIEIFFFLKCVEYWSLVLFYSLLIIFLNEIIWVFFYCIWCGVFDIKNEEWWLEYELFFKCLRFFYKDWKYLDYEYCIFLDCWNIFVVDLWVSVKFGYFDVMKGIFIVEC